MKKLILIMLGVMFLSGCISFSKIKTGTLKTTGITIKADDGSFTVKPNETFTVPSATDVCGNNYVFGYDIESLKDGAAKVKIHFDDGSPFLFGKMLFCHRATGNSTIAYTTADHHIVQIPTKFIERARQGLNTKVYQKINNTEGNTGYGWVLWLSNKPFE